MTISGPGRFRLKNAQPWIRWLRQNENEPSAALVAAFVYNQVLIAPFDVGEPLGRVDYIRRAQPQGSDISVIWGIGEDDEGAFVEILAPGGDEEL